MKKRLENIMEEYINKERMCDKIKELEELKVRYLGKKGEVTKILKEMGRLTIEERKEIGEVGNRVRKVIEERYRNKIKEIERINIEKQLEDERIDVSMGGKEIKRGGRHPISKVLREIEDIFYGMGFSIVEGPEIEKEYYNFDALNIEEGHPARDTQDTFYVEDKILLRTQTSPVQIRVMEKEKPPIRIISPGRVYRADEVDATHSPIFHQIEGLVIDEGITMGDLKGTLELFIKRLYGEDVDIRFRAHHFPFTEPSAEIDIKCFKCNGKGCRICKGEGWIEILGAGMVHPKVLSNCGIDGERYRGFAFGMGLERIVMRRYNIEDLRLLYENDIRFLEQF